MKTEQNKPAGRVYWRSLDELAHTPDFQKWVGREFPELLPDMFSPVTRRRFLSLMGASAALAGATGCIRRPEEHILPYTKLPEDVLPGQANHYATTVVRGGVGLGLLVESHTGRPTKIEGNPNHAASLGAVDGQTLASILHLYDPDRSHGPVKGGAYTSWEEVASFFDSHFADLRAKGGAGLAFLAESDASPTMARLRAKLAEVAPQARWFTWEPINDDQAKAGLKTAYGQDLAAIYDLAAADVVLSLDADFLGPDPRNVVNARAFASRRRIGRAEEGLNRLYAVEGTFSVTGAAADHRLRVLPSQVELFTRALAVELGAKGVAVAGAEGLSGGDAFKGAWLSGVVEDLVEKRGRSLVVAGDRQPAEVHALVAAINEALGNVGAAVKYVPSATAAAGEGPSGASIAALVADLGAGKVDTLVIVGGNPVYNAPADLGFAGALAKASTSIHLSNYWDETGIACSWHLPRAHFLEAWGDARAIDGTASIVQPLIEPMFGGWSDVELLGRVVGDARDDYELVQDTWRAGFTGLSFEKAWRSWLHNGVVAESAFAPVAAVLDGAAVQRALSARAPSDKAASASSLEISFVADSKVHDGRFANNAWLQELPDPITNLSWDNAALMSLKTAEALGVKSGDLVKVDYRGRSLEIAAMVLPGLADNLVVLPLGYGRKNAGRVGDGVGFDTYTIRDSAALWGDVGATVSRTGGTYALATTQEHYGTDTHGIEKQIEEVEHRHLVREGTLAQFQEKPTFAQEMVHHPPLDSIWGEGHEYPGQQWGMVIDLNACVGCNACTVACQSENNIPVVGKEQIIKGREMTWIRLDRYFAGSVEDPQIVHQPIACMHCENAPCETVCPVNATAHGHEGTNDMAYNRCIGTRYCANNCPFKVRRFNYLDWHGDVDELVKMVHNPDVTVRMRGVMEKCSYCIQRIHRARRDATVNGRDAKNLPDGAVTPACAQACPSQAITFGNINDPESRVAKLKKQDRNYDMLAELNIKPRTSYLARIRNPNQKLG